MFCLFRKLGICWYPLWVCWVRFMTSSSLQAWKLQFFSSSESSQNDMSYCWWLKSCTTWDVWNPINNGTFTISTGAGFQPSTVCFKSMRGNLCSMFLLYQTRNQVFTTTTKTWNGNIDPACHASICCFLFRIFSDPRDSTHISQPVFK